MAGESATFGGTIRHEAGAAVVPSCREARVSRLEGDRLLVSIRSLMGDARPVPARGWAPRVRESGGELELVEPQRGDRVWVAPDEGGEAGGSLVVVAWEPV